MKSVFSRPMAFVGIFFISALLVAKYQNCAPTMGDAGTYGSTSTNPPYLTGPWNGTGSSSITMVALNMTSATPQYIFPATQISVSITVTGSAAFNIEGGVNGSSGQTYFTECTGASSTTTGGTVTQTCTFSPGVSGFPVSISGNNYQMSIPMFVNVVDQYGNVLMECSSVTGVCTGNAYSQTYTTLPLGYQIGSNCYLLSYTGGTFTMAKPSATFTLNNPAALLAGFASCTGSNCCDTSGNCFNTSGGYNGSSPGTCL